MTLRENIADVFRQAFWFAKQHPGKGERIDVSGLTVKQAENIVLLFREHVEKIRKGQPLVTPDYRAGFDSACDKIMRELNE